MVISLPFNIAKHRLSLLQNNETQQIRSKFTQGLEFNLELLLSFLPLQIKCSC